MAVGRSILVTAYYVLLRNQPNDELGADYFLTRGLPEAHVRRLVRQLGRHRAPRVTLERLMPCDLTIGPLLIDGSDGVGGSPAFSPQPAQNSR